MNLSYRSSFKKDVDKVHDKFLLMALRYKINQIENAFDTTHITGLKLLRGYRTHYRIKVFTDELSFRIGAIIRGNSIWLIRFLPRKKIYKNFL